jgi:hypothetical protein
MRTPVAADEGDWVAADEAAQLIGVPARRTRWFIMNGHLTAATRPDGARGVTRASVQSEARWRREGSALGRLRRLLGYVVTWSP